MAEAGVRNYSFSSSLLHQGESVTWRADFDTELRSLTSKVAPVESRQHVRPTIDCRLKYHVVAWISKLRTPQESKAYRFRDGYNGLEQRADILFRQSRRGEMFRSAHDGFVLDDQRH